MRLLKIEYACALLSWSASTGSSRPSATPFLTICEHRSAQSMDSASLFRKTSQPPSTTSAETILAESVASDLQEQNRERNLSFDIEAGLNAYADPRLTRIALENLMSNAVKFSSKVARAEIRFGWDPEQNAWYVRDNGAGFDMTYADKLFGAFNRLHGDKDFRGSGIGLATVARVVHGHHGRIWANSAVDQGATFWFTLE